jgi:hypothetical protein
MAYAVEIRESIRDYLAAVPGLREEDYSAVLDGVTEELSQNADYFLEKYPLGHESLHFRYDYPHPTTHTLFNFDFVVDASQRGVGVVRVVYVECTTEPMA